MDIDFDTQHSIQQRSMNLSFDYPVDHSTDHMDYSHLDEAVLSPSMQHSTLATMIVLIVGLTFNMVFLWSLLTGDKRSRLRPFLINLALADLMVCCFTLGMELGWRLTITWDAGDFACRLFSMTKTLGLYVEAFVVMVMCVDRWYVVMYPLRMENRMKRARYLLASAWLAATVCSIPQAIVYHVEQHPFIPNFVQCVTLYSFPNQTAEKAYVIFGILAMYVLPLLVIMILSLFLLWKLTSKYSTKRANSNNKIVNNKRLQIEDAISIEETSFNTESLVIGRFSKPLQFSANTMRRKNHARTIHLSVIIIVTFVCCYTPYAILMVATFLVGNQFEEADLSEVTEALLMLTISFSTILNPVIYGTYLIYTRKSLRGKWTFFRFKPAKSLRRQFGEISSFQLSMVAYDF